MQRAERDKLIIARMLEDVQTLRDRVEHFSLDGEKFANDRSFEGEIAFDATMNPLYRIVEDAVHLSDRVTACLPEIPWHNLRGFRNIVAHGYWEIDREAAWLIIRDDIPELVSALERYIEGNTEA